MQEYSIEPIKYIIRETVPSHQRNDLWPLPDISDNACYVEFTGRGWKVSPWGSPHLCWSECYMTFFWDENPSGRNDEYIAACRYDKDTAVRIAKELIERKEGCFYTTWAKRGELSPPKPAKLEEIVMALEGTSYNDEIMESKVDAIKGIAKSSGIVIVFGRSDDLIEFRGAINAELDAWRGGRYVVSPDGVIELENGTPDKPNMITAHWPMWRYETSIPHKEFTVYMDKPEEGEEMFAEVYCTGIAFYLKDLEILI